MSNPIEIYAIKVTQPYGDFFQTVMSADELLKCIYVNQAEMDDGEISGVQRKESTPRALDIAKFIDSDEAAFPNSIILSVNHNEDDIPAEEDEKWRFEQVKDDLYKIIIPDIDLKLCSVIDGQHRLLGFRYAKNKAVQLPCSIYDALPPSNQATIFSTINFNQQKVPKSLAYRLFGYSLDDIAREYWPPDLLAVYFSEKFNKMDGYPFYKRLKNRVLHEVTAKDWSISSSVFIDGVLSLISKNPRSDRYTINAIYSSEKEKGRKRLLSGNSKDNSPLRLFYINDNDKAIEQILNIFFTTIKEHFWTDDCIENGTILVRTVGVSALFKFLRKKLADMPKISKVNLEKLCSALKEIDPEEFTKSDEYTSTTVGQGKIYNYLNERVKVDL
ncbi:DNA phosphorothioation-associated DGQHR protein 1 [Salmonella enterica]|uniref:DNA phosphorothioation-associated DGQHR protein 1 n=1 Tax=Salmonella enterica TaxID=28901 RepID=UPI001601959C|nr:DNA phosphorothioation-associated DGQHR protein 1 [Salmonella enterica]